MTEFTKACIGANRKLSQALSEHSRDTWYEKGTVGAGGDVSSGIDIFAEEIFVEYLGGFGQISSEESGLIGEGESTIIIDPIDGSSNFLSSFPYYGTSVAKVGANGMLESAIVCNLANGDIFVKEGSGSTLQGQLTHDIYREPSHPPSPEAGLFERSYKYPEVVAALGQQGMKFRSPGATALSLAYAHSTQFFLFVGEYRIYDFAAGLALCEGMEVIVEADYVIVSKSKEIAKNIEKIVRRSR